PVPIILVSAYHDASLIERAEANHILGYLVKPIKQADLEPSIALAVRRFEEFQALQKETADLRQAAQDRKVIGQAHVEGVNGAGLREGYALPASARNEHEPRTSPLSKSADNLSSRFHLAAKPHPPHSRRVGNRRCAPVR